MQQTKWAFQFHGSRLLQQAERDAVEIGSDGMDTPYRRFVPKYSVWSCYSERMKWQRKYLPLYLPASCFLNRPGQLSGGPEEVPASMTAPLIKKNESYE